jgi:hypothetical protein
VPTSAGSVSLASACGEVSRSSGLVAAGFEVGLIDIHTMQPVSGVDLMADLFLETAEVEAAKANVHSAIDRLVAMIVGRHPFAISMASGVAEGIGRHLVGAVISALSRAEDPFERLRLICVLEQTEVHDTSEVVRVLSRLAVADPDEEIRFHAGEIRDEIERLDPEWEGFDHASR